MDIAKRMNVCVCVSVCVCIFKGTENQNELERTSWGSQHFVTKRAYGIVFLIAMGH